MAKPEMATFNIAWISLNLRSMSLNVSLTPSLEAFVREKVAQGEYDSASEVMREALLLLKRREELWKVEA